MADDARFQDVLQSDSPLRLAVESGDDLGVASALVQDAVGRTGEIAWMPRRRRLALLVNRFRWEDREIAERQGRPYERVRSALLFNDVERVRTNGLDPADKDTVFSILRIGFEEVDAPSGTITIDLAGDGALALDVECLNVQIADLSRPWATRNLPDHGPAT